MRGAIGIWTLALCSLPVASHSAAIVDQSSRGFANAFYSDINRAGSPPPEIGQTFKAGITGRLSGVGLGLYRDQLYSDTTPIGYYNSGALISIRDANNTLLGRGSIAAGSIPLRDSFSQSQPISVVFGLDALSINLTAGQTYSFGITPTQVVPSGIGGNGLDLAASFPTYADGFPFVSADDGRPRQPFFADSYDLIFDTYMTPALTIEPLNVTGSQTGANGATWNYQYETEVKDFTVYVREKIQLVGDTPSQALVDQWLAGMNGIWSNKFQLSDGEFNYKVVVEASFVDSGGDQIVNFINGSGRSNMLNWYSDNGWEPQYQGAAAAHELGHMLGVYDEYTGGSVDPEVSAEALCAGNKAQAYCGSLMADLGPVQERYFAEILKYLQEHTDRNLSIANLPPAPGGYQAPPPLQGLVEEPVLNSAVPEPGTYAVLILGFGGVGAYLRMLRQRPGTRRKTQLLAV